jgi:hypothetical protein
MRTKFLRNRHWQEVFNGKNGLSGGRREAVAAVAKSIIYQMALLRRLSGFVLQTTNPLLNACNDTRLAVFQFEGRISG